MKFEKVLRSVLKRIQKRHLHFIIVEYDGREDDYNFENFKILHMKIVMGSQWKKLSKLFKECENKDFNNLAIGTVLLTFYIRRYIGGQIYVTSHGDRCLASSDRKRYFTFKWKTIESDKVK